MKDSKISIKDWFLKRLNPRFRYTSWDAPETFVKKLSMPDPGGMDIPADSCRIETQEADENGAPLVSICYLEFADVAFTFQVNWRHSVRCKNIVIDSFA